MKTQKNESKWFDCTVLHLICPAQDPSAARWRSFVILLYFQYQNSLKAKPLCQLLSELLTLAVVEL